jgi:hypothetical protein
MYRLCITVQLSQLHRTVLVPQALLFILQPQGWCLIPVVFSGADTVQSVYTHILADAAL